MSFFSKALACMLALLTMCAYSPRIVLSQEIKDTASQKEEGFQTWASDEVDIAGKPADKDPADGSWFSRYKWWLLAGLVVVAGGAAAAAAGSGSDSSGDNGDGGTVDIGTTDDSGTDGESTGSYTVTW